MKVLRIAVTVQVLALMGVGREARRWAVKRSLWRQGISMERIYFGGDVSGLLFAIAIMAAALYGIPSMWRFFLPAIGGGLAVAGVLWRLRGRG
jgi:hypothetical protein